MEQKLTGLAWNPTILPVAVTYQSPNGTRLGVSLKYLATCSTMLALRVGLACPKAAAVHNSQSIR